MTFQSANVDISTAHIQDVRSRFFEKKRNRCNFSPWGRKCFVCLPPLLVTFLQQHLSLILISCRVAKSRRSIWHRCSTKTEEKTGNLQIHMIYYEICNLIWSLKAFFPLDSFDFFDQWLFTIYICLYIYFFLVIFRHCSIWLKFFTTSTKDCQLFLGFVN